MKKIFSAVAITVFVALIAVFFTPSCNRNRDCKVLVSVVDDSLAEPVKAAACTLYCTPNTCIIEEIESTGVDGQAEFVFPNPAILLVSVTVGQTTYEGGYVELKPGETVEHIVEIPY